MTNELYHYGVLGMKWGVRRYQDENGHLTKEGRAKYREDKKQIKLENKKAKRLGRDATDYALAVNRATQRGAKLEAKAQKLIDKNPDSKRTEKAKIKALAARDSATRLAGIEKDLRTRAEDHVSQLKAKYGEDKVKDIKYKEIELSKKTVERFSKMGIEMPSKRSVVYEGRAQEGLRNGIIAGALAAGATLTASAMGIPMTAIVYMEPKFKSIENQSYEYSLRKARESAKK